MTREFSSLSDIGSYLRERRSTQFPSVAAVRRAHDGPFPNAAVIGAYERGNLPGDRSERFGQYLDAVGFSADEQTALRGRIRELKQEARPSSLLSRIQKEEVREVAPERYTGNPRRVLLKDVPDDVERLVSAAVYDIKARMFELEKRLEQEADFDGKFALRHMIPTSKATVSQELQTPLDCDARLRDALEQYATELYIFATTDTTAGYVM